MRCVIAGGGTGGHLFPGIAIAEAFMDKEQGNEVLFIGTERGIEARVLPEGKFPLKTIEAKPLKGMSLVATMRGVCAIPKAIGQAFRILKESKPQMVIGVGGYASGPTVVAAFLLRINRAIHEQNMVPGMTNRWLKWISQRIFVSFEETRRFFPKRKTFVTGMPIRRNLLSCVSEQKTDRAAGTEGERFTVLIFGGSAGAHRINRAMIEALDALAGIKSSLRVIHQTGKIDLDFVSRGYQEKGFDALVRPFFENMGSCYATSDVVICRAGASTIAELAVCGKAAILVPYPHAAHQHQLLNAQKLVAMGAARMIRDEELEGASLSHAILQMVNHPEERRTMEGAIQKMARPRAAQEIVDHCYALVGENMLEVGG
jgi:UDP-N-acetylglucosamine--N-acetylmuramyl-(pentapeptide) pyrophosphoryl-undecaprenol N-acetylglucosamine transferase